MWKHNFVWSREFHWNCVFALSTFVFEILNSPVTFFVDFLLRNWPEFSDKTREADIIFKSAVLEFLALGTRTLGLITPSLGTQRNNVFFNGLSEVYILCTMNDVK